MRLLDEVGRKEYAKKMENAKRIIEKKGRRTVEE